MQLQLAQEMIDALRTRGGSPIFGVQCTRTEPTVNFQEHTPTVADALTYALAYGQSVLMINASSMTTGTMVETTLYGIASAMPKGNGKFVFKVKQSTETILMVEIQHTP